MSRETVPRLLREVAERDPEGAAYCFKQDGEWTDLSWRDFHALVRRISRSLMAMGVESGEMVGLLSETRMEWVAIDFAVGSCGGVTAGIYQSSLAPACAYILNHCEAEVLFAENTTQLDKIFEVRADLPHLKRIVLIEGASDPAHDVLSWDEFLALSDQVSEEDRQARADSIKTDDLLSLVYTSGTTGTPKGAMLSHRNILSASESVGEMLYSEIGFRTLLFLPLAHVFARLIVYLSMDRGCTVAFADEITKVPDYLRELEPDFIASVPRIYEKVYDKVVSTAESAPPLRRAIFHRAIDVGMQVSRLQQDGRPIPPLLKLRHRIFERLVYRKVQAVFGGKLLYGVSGAAPLNKTIAEFFHACGVLILEGIGMTENSSFSNVNQLDANKFGTVGRAGPGVEVKIADDGEVLIRGDNVMQGYYKDPAATAEAIDAEGWLMTGDIGEIDEDGFLKITDRKKDLIITAGGKNIAPQRIERIMRTSHFVSNVMAYGDRRKFISAVITLDPPSVREWAIQKGLGTEDLEALARHPKVHELIEREVAERNQQLASFETIKRFHLVARDFSIEGGELTPTMKIKRKVVVELYGDALEALYQDADAG